MPAAVRRQPPRFFFFFFFFSTDMSYARRSDAADIAQAIRLAEEDKQNHSSRATVAAPPSDQHHFTAALPQIPQNATDAASFFRVFLF